MKGFQILSMLFLGLAFTSCSTYQSTEPRVGTWGEKVELAGVENLHKIDANLYRSAQPTHEGMKNLEKLGVKTIINLRTFGSDKDELKGTQLKGVHIPMLAWLPKDSAEKKFLTTVSDKSEGPYLVHCLHGSDRTGCMTAIYRARQQGWSSDNAVQEMMFGGYGFHKIFKRMLIPWTIKKAESK